MTEESHLYQNVGKRSFEQVQKCEWLLNLVPFLSELSRFETEMEDCTDRTLLSQQESTKSQQDYFLYAADCWSVKTSKVNDRCLKMKRTMKRNESIE